MNASKGLTDGSTAASRAAMPLLIGLDEKNYPVAIRDFQDSAFDAKKYIQSHLGDSADYQVRDYLIRLRHTREQIGKDMQRNLFNNYSQFVKISSEIMTLEQEIRSTRNMMNELCSLVIGMRLDKDSAGISSTKESTKEDSSIALPILRQATRSDMSHTPPMQDKVEARQELVRSISSASSKSQLDKKNGTRERQVLEERLLELDVMIAHRHLEDAVSTIGLRTLSILFSPALIFY